MAISLLNEKQYQITDKVIVNIPTLGEYRSKKHRQDYETLMNLFLVTPSNYMVELYDIGRDFRNIKEYDFFMELFYIDYVAEQGQGSIDSTILFPNLDFNSLYVGEDNGKLVLMNENEEIVIDEYVYLQIGAVFCEVLNTKKYRRKPANKTAYEYIIDVEREHKRNRKRMKRQQESGFDELIVALVCDKGFPYDFESVNKLTIYDFYCCVQQIMKRTNYENIMRGAYSGMGTVDLKKIKKSDLNYLSFRS